MDLLKSLNLQDHLPEQQTRTSHLFDDNPEFNLALGFDACCRCGKPSTSFECTACHRVKYCSPECRAADATPPTGDPQEGEEEALGHSAVICSVLNLCNDDEVMEDGKEHSLDTVKRNAAVDRLVSEFESYPATLANVIMDGPCYQDALAKSSRGSLVIHIIGASIDSELWQGHPDSSQEARVYQGYAEALAEIADRFNLTMIDLYFIGPDCPRKDSRTDVKVPQTAGSSNHHDCILRCSTMRGEYNSGLLTAKSVPNPNIVAFFNPGFTVPDYSWEEALLTVPQGTPCLTTTNTELEGVADIEFLYEAGLITELPAALAVMLKEESIETADTFFSVNPYCGNRIRQSGTMANDIYVKNRWIFGGIFGTVATEAAAKSSGKRQRVEGSGNSKQSNPALV